MYVQGDLSSLRKKIVVFDLNVLMPACFCLGRIGMAWATWWNSQINVNKLY